MFSLNLIIIDYFSRPCFSIYFNQPSWHNFRMHNVNKFDIICQNLSKFRDFPIVTVSVLNISHTPAWQKTEVVAYHAYGVVLDYQFKFFDLKVCLQKNYCMLPSKMGAYCYQLKLKNQSTFTNLSKYETSIKTEKSSKTLKIIPNMKNP